MSEAVENNIIRLYIIKLSKWLMLTMPILFLFYRENGLATQDLFLLKSVYSFSIVVLEVPSGYIGDVWGRKASLVLGSVLGFIGFVLYCFATGFWAFLVCEIILGVGQSFISGSDSALLYDSLQASRKEKEYLKIEGRMISAGNFAEAVAAPLGKSEGMTRDEAMFKRSHCNGQPENPFLFPGRCGLCRSPGRPDPG